MSSKVFLFIGLILFSSFVSADVNSVQYINSIQINIVNNSERSYNLLTYPALHYAYITTDYNTFNHLNSGTTRIAITTYNQPLESDMVFSYGNIGNHNFSFHLSVQGNQMSIDPPIVKNINTSYSYNCNKTACQVTINLNPPTKHITTVIFNGNFTLADAQNYASVILKYLAPTIISQQGFDTNTPADTSKSGNPPFNYSLSTDHTQLTFTFYQNYEKSS